MQKLGIESLLNASKALLNKATCLELLNSPCSQKCHWSSLPNLYLYGVPITKPLFLFQLLIVATDTSFIPLKLRKKGKLEAGKHLGKITQEQTSKCWLSACT